MMIETYTDLFRNIMWSIQLQFQLLSDQNKSFYSFLTILRNLLLTFLAMDRNHSHGFCKMESLDERYHLNGKICCSGRFGTQGTGTLNHFGSELRERS